MRKKDIEVGQTYTNRRHPKGRYVGGIRNGRKEMVITEAIETNLIGGICCAIRRNRPFWAAFVPVN